MMYVYILTNKNHSVLCTGVTNDLARRVFEHTNGGIEGFTKRYNVHRLVFYESFEDPYFAISREKQIKAGSGAKKEALICSINPEWQDLSDQLGLSG